jgi:N-acetylmuramic acid 6-phosphate etherase
MVDVKTANNKLVDRARRIFRTLLPHTLLQDHQIDELITACGGSVKLALVVQKYGCSIEDARDKLDKAGGVLKRAWAQDPVDEHPHPQGKPQMVLCIDAGGTTCSVVIANADGIQARAEAGPCNLYGHSFIFLLSD